MVMGGQSPQILPSLSFQDLPPEVLSEIFLSCLEDVPADFSNYYAPTNVSQVCRRWRKVAFSTPRLWSSFSFDCQVNPADSPAHTAIANTECDRFIKHVIPTLKTWIARSSHSPLDFTIFVRIGEEARELANEIDALMGILFDQRARWECVTVIFDHSLARWVGVTYSGMPMLKSLRFEQCFSPDHNTTLDLTVSKNIESLFVHGDIKILYADRFPHLTSLHLLPGGFSRPAPFPSFRECFNFLRRAPSLEKLEAICEGEDVGDWLSDHERSYDENIKLANLRSLRLWLGRNMHDRPQQYSAFIAHLTLPSLESLDIGCHSRVAYSPIDAQLVDLVRRSNAHITSLKLDSAAADENEVINLLKILPRLRKLQLHGVSRLNMVFSDLTLTGVPERDICPQLESLHLRYLDNLSSTLLSECIISRWRGPASSTIGSDASRADQNVFCRSLGDVWITNSTVCGELSSEVLECKKEGLCLVQRYTVR